MTGVSFIDAVADRSGRPVEDVADLLESASVPTLDTGGAPHRLRVTRLAFTGVKAGVSTDHIDFDQRFGDGLWALTSEKNERGKTSILEIIMWVLRGEPKRLQEDVRSWLHTVRLEGTIDGEPFVVEFRLSNGEPTGTLSWRDEERPFSSTAAFADTMSTFMMGQLGFDSFPQWVKNKGMSTHGWLLYSTVLYMPHGEQKAVVGDTTEAGLAQRLVQLFIGVPWARTSIACQAALKAAQAETRDKRDSERTIQEAATALLEERQRELKAAMAELAILPEGLPDDKQIEAGRAAWLDLIGRHADAVGNLRDAQRHAKAAKREATRRKRQLTDLTESAIAAKVFQGLDPINCPRCQVAIEADRKQAEVDTHLCAVCNRSMELDRLMGSDTAHADSEDDGPLTAEELKKLVARAGEAAEKEFALVEELKEQADEEAQQLAIAKSRVDAHASHLAQVQYRRELETRVATLEAVIAEMGILARTTTEPTSPDTSAEDQIEILSAATNEARKRVKDKSADVVEQIDQAILDLARRFGLENLQTVHLDLAARLKLMKGGVASWFSRQTPGEKLRLRIAVIIALLRVAHENRIGRHPGLLLIDSIGAAETEPGDLAAFMRELGGVATELGIERIVASARPEILDHVPEGHRVSAGGEEYLW